MLSQILRARLIRAFDNKCPHEAMRQMHRTYADETLNFCLEDGSPLAAVHDPEATLLATRQDLTLINPTAANIEIAKPRSRRRYRILFLLLVVAAVLVGLWVVGWMPSLRPSSAETSKGSTTTFTRDAFVEFDERGEYWCRQKMKVQLYQLGPKSHFWGNTAVLNCAVCNVGGSKCQIERVLVWYTSADMKTVNWSEGGGWTAIMPGECKTFDMESSRLGEPFHLTRPLGKLYVSFNTEGAEAVIDLNDFDSRGFVK